MLATFGSLQVIYTSAKADQAFIDALKQKRAGTSDEEFEVSSW